MADITDFVNFDLLLTAAPGGYRARVVDSPAGEAASSFTLPFSDLEVENLILRLTQRSAGTRRLESVEVGMVRTFGTTLFGAVFAGDVGVCWQKSRSVVAQQDYSRLAPPDFADMWVSMRAAYQPKVGCAVYNFFASFGRGFAPKFHQRRPGAVDSLQIVALSPNT